MFKKNKKLIGKKEQGMVIVEMLNGILKHIKKNKKKIKIILSKILVKFIK
jgi:hypothetical protein